ncbi:MAG: hypothetical protein KC502_16085 [Myxococcales bacterium]|nr:hypothetical protein [Myxococcales bacterium]
MRQLAQRHALPVLALLGVVFALYGRTAEFHFVDWDDRHHVYANPAVVAPDTASVADRWLGRNIGYPLPITLATWRLDQALHGPDGVGTAKAVDGVGYHKSQLLIIVLFAGVLYLLAWLGTASPWAAALFGAVILAHPVVAEPLSWVTGRKDLLMALFTALTLMLLWRAGSHEPAAKPGKNRVHLWFWAGVCASLAMLSKPTGIALAPFFVWTVTLGTHHRPNAEERSPTIAIGLWLCALAAGIVVVGSLWHAELGGVGGKQGAPLNRVLHATGWHLRMLAAPSWLRAKYIVATPADIGLGEMLTGAAGLGFVTVSIVWRRQPVGWAAALALLAWLPVSNIVPLRRHIADSYVLVPWIVLAWGALMTAWRVERARRIVLLVAGGLVLLLGGRAVDQIETWRDSVHLWKQTLRHEPNSPQVCRMAGHGQYFENQKVAAMRTWHACAERYGPALFANNLAATALQVGDRAAAERWAKWILERRPGDPRALRYLHAARNQPSPSSGRRN